MRMKEKHSQSSGKLIKYVLKVFLITCGYHQRMHVFKPKFDLEKTLQLPFLRTNEVYYSRQLSLYNLGIHYFPQDQGIMHLLTENEGKRFRRCILMLESFFAKNIDEHVKTIIGFSDACDG